jgi:glycosyltransferase involved in cell wall biosynthesis
VSSPHKPNVLLLHNRYREPGGEERSVAQIAALLASRGHRCEVLERSSERLGGGGGRARAALSMLSGGSGAQEVGAAVAGLGAQVVHAHNINPLFGSKALEAARGAGARVVMHLHNYRLVCAIAIAFRDGEICTRCHGRNTFPGLRLRCRGSVAEAATYAAALSLHQRRVLRSVDAFVVPSGAARQRLASLGIPPAGVTVLPNFLRDEELAPSSHAGSGKYALYAGRLAVEKGVDIAIEAARRTRIPLLVAGAGPDAERLRKVAAGAPVRFTGRLSPMGLADARRRAAFAVMPSRWDEPCPYAAIEALAAGLPVLASHAGGLPELVGGASAVPAGDAAALGQAMEELWTDRELRQRRGEEALARARERFGAERFYSGLMRIYTGTAGGA